MTEKKHNDITDLAEEHRKEIESLLAAPVKCRVVRPKDPGVPVHNFTAEVKKRIIDQANEMMEGLGFSVIVRLITLPQEEEGDTKRMIATDSMHKEQVYNGFMGLVVLLGEDAYKAYNVKTKKPYVDKPWVSVGDVIVFPRTAGYYMFDNETGVTYYVLKEHAPDIRVKDKYVHRFTRK